MESGGTSPGGLLKISSCLPQHQLHTCSGILQTVVTAVCEGQALLIFTTGIRGNISGLERRVGGLIFSYFS